MGKKKTTKKEPVAKKTVKKAKVGDYRVIIYNDMGQVQRNKFTQGTLEEVEKVADEFRKGVSKGGKVEITSV